MATKTEKDQTTKEIIGSLTKAKKNYSTPSPRSADDEIRDISNALQNLRDPSKALFLKQMAVLLHRLVSKAKSCGRLNLLAAGPPPRFPNDGLTETIIACWQAANVAYRMADAPSADGVTKYLRQLRQGKLITPILIEFIKVHLRKRVVLPNMVGGQITIDDEPPLFTQKTMKPVLAAIKILLEVVTNQDAPRGWISAALDELGQSADSKSLIDVADRSWILRTAGELVHHRLSPSGIYTQGDWRDIHRSDLSRLQKDKLLSLIDYTSELFWDHRVSSNHALANHFAVFLEDVLGAFPEVKCDNKPVWKSATRELFLDDNLIKQFGLQAKAQMKILEKFQEMNWKASVQFMDVVDNLRLSRTLYLLRKCTHPIQFEIAGKGRVRWWLTNKTDSPS